MKMQPIQIKPSMNNKKEMIKRHKEKQIKSLLSLLKINFDETFFNVKPNHDLEQDLNLIFSFKGTRHLKKITTRNENNKESSKEFVRIQRERLQESKHHDHNLFPQLTTAKVVFNKHNLVKKQTNEISKNLIGNKIPEDHSRSPSPAKRVNNLPVLFSPYVQLRKIVYSAPTKTALCLINNSQKLYKPLEFIKSIHNYNQIDSQIISKVSVNHPQTYLYCIRDKKDIKNIIPIMSHRINWKPSTDKHHYNFLWKYSTKKIDYKKLTFNESISKDKFQTVNLFENHTEISNKKTFFLNMINYCNKLDINTFEVVPFTIIMHKMDKVFQQNYASFSEVFDFLTGIISNKNNFNILTNKKYSELFKLTAMPSQDSFLENTPIFIPKTFISDKNYWVIKPNDLCQGKCIKLCNDKVKILKKMKKYFMGIDRTYKDSEDEMKSTLNPLNTLKPPKIKIKIPSQTIQTEENKNTNGSPEVKKKKVLLTRYVSNSIILQKYLEQPLLYNNRKFDIRMWVIVDHCLNVFMFKEGHLKASSEEYNCNNMDPFVHLTNYSVQKNSSNFSKYEFGNEISFSDFQKFLESNKNKIKICEDILPQIKSIIDLSMNSVGKNLNKRNSNFCFQMFGYDFIIDKNFKVWLLEINDNPGLSESSPLIKILVPRMIDDCFRLTLDKIYDTQYDSSIYDKSTGIYKSPYPIEGYSDNDNMFEFVCNLTS